MRESNYIYINWESSGDIEAVRIELYEDGYYHSSIDSYESNDGSYSYNPSSSIDNGWYYQIKISDYSDPDIYDLSENFYVYD